MYMESKDFVAKLAKKINRDNKDVSIMLNSLSQVFRENLINLDSIAIPGFGEFYTIKEDEIITIDSTSKKRVLIPPQIKILFTPSTILKKRLTE